VKRDRSEGILADLVAIRAEQQPDLDVLTFEHLSLDEGATSDEVRTFADLHDNANRIAAELVARGLEPGQRFGLMMGNHPEFVETMIAASVTGTVFVPIDPRGRGEKLAYQLADAGCRGLVCGDYSLPAISAVRASTPIEWVLALGDISGSDDVAPLAAVLDAPRATVDVRLEGEDDPLQIIYTSGTTGDPKGVVFSNGRFGAYTMMGLVAGYKPGDRPYTGLSLTHGNAQAVTLGPALGMGLRAVFSRGFTKSRLWDVCRAHGCTQFSLLGGMATAIYSEPPRPDDADNPVRFITSAGMPAAIWEAFESRFDVEILEWYAAVEGGLAVKPIGEGPIGSFGRPLGVEMQVLDAGDAPCPTGQIGEICSRPLGREADPVEYFENPEASAAKTRGGWLRSGDMGHTDADGWFFFDYRKGGGIRHNGDFVNPGFVEKVVAEHPLVDDVFVYGVPAASGAPGEKDVVAVVVAAEGIAADWDAVFEACATGLEANFVPTYIQIVDEIPKTASEKPQERFLLEAFSADTHSVVIRPER
jgi:crotonobetaine/carnitine-CoA ligase